MRSSVGPTSASSKRAMGRSSSSEKVRLKRPAVTVTRLCSSSSPYASFSARFGFFFVSSAKSTRNFVCSLPVGLATTRRKARCHPVAVVVGRGRPLGRAIGRDQHRRQRHAGVGVERARPREAGRPHPGLAEAHLGQRPEAHPRGGQPVADDVVAGLFAVRLGLPLRLGVGIGGRRGLGGGRRLGGGGRRGLRRGRWLSAGAGAAGVGSTVGVGAGPGAGSGAACAICSEKTRRRSVLVKRTPSRMMRGRGARLRRDQHPTTSCRRFPR